MSSDLHRRTQFGSRRGGTLVETAMAATVFLLLIVAVIEFARMGFAYNSVSFAAHRAVRFASVRGSTSTHPASASDVRALATSYIAALDTSKLGVTTSWTPNNSPGSTVQVTVTYGFKSILVPISSSLVNLQTVCREVITQ